jgi:ADP-glucose pyrophosphorylase
LLSGGVIVRGATVTHSVLSSNVTVDADSVVDQAVLLPGARIGPGCKIRRVIVDANVVVPPGTIIGVADQGAISLVTRESLERMPETSSHALQRRVQPVLLMR